MPNISIHLHLAVLAVVLSTLPASAHYALPPLSPVVAQSDSGPERPLVRVNVLGKDERTDVPDELEEVARGVGLLFNAEAAMACTAFCVAPDMIATNAHCLLRKRGGRGAVRLSDIRFSPIGAFVETNTPQYGLKRVADDQPRLSFLAGHFRNASSIRQQGGDWAIAKLRYGTCLGRALQFAYPSSKEIVQAARDKRLFMIGFHGDKPLDQKWYSPECGVRSSGDKRHFLPSQRRDLRRAGNILPHTCDMTEGASGSPIFMQTEDGPKVIAINSGGTGFTRYTQRADGSRRKVVARRFTNLAVLASAFRDVLPRFDAENLLTDIDEFTELQVLLKHRGLYTKAIDGLYGPGSKAAILAREEELGLAPLGMPTWELLKGLRDERQTHVLSLADAVMDRHLTRMRIDDAQAHEDETSSQ